MIPIKQDKIHVLVLGGYGFLGSAIVRSLLHAPEYMIYVIDKLEHWTATSSVQRNPRVQFLNCDVGEVEKYAALLPEKVDYLVHCASSVTNVGMLCERSAACGQLSASGELSACGQLSMSDQLSSSGELSVGGRPSPCLCVDALQRDRHLAEAFEQEKRVFGVVSQLARMHRVEKLLYLSSALIDGWEVDSPFDRMREFGRFKHEMERHIIDTCSELPYIIARLPLQFGIFQSGLQFIPGVILHLVGQKTLTVCEERDRRFQWSYVDDTALVLRELLRRGQVRQVYTVPGTELSVQQICDALIACSGSQSDALSFASPVSPEDTPEQEKCSIEDSSGPATLTASPIDLHIDRIHSLQTIEERLALTYEFYEDNYDYYCKKLNIYIERGIR